MGIKFNPVTGQLDLTGTGGSGGSVTKYTQTFNSTTDWGSPSGGVYTLTVTAAIHGKGTNPTVEILELSGSDYVNIMIAYKLNASGDLIVEALETPNNRFSGKIILI